MDRSHASPARGQRRQVQKARRRGASTVLFNIVQFINGLLGCICELHDQLISIVSCKKIRQCHVICMWCLEEMVGGLKPQASPKNNMFTKGSLKDSVRGCKPFLGDSKFATYVGSDLNVDVPMFFSVFWFHVKFQSHMVTSVSHFAGHNSTEGIEGTAGERDSPMARGRRGLGSMAL